MKIYLFLVLTSLCLATASFAQLNLGNDTLVCTGQYRTLDAGPHGPYLWSTGDTTRTIRVYQSGNYGAQDGTGTKDNIDITIYHESYNQASVWPVGNGNVITFDTSAAAGRKPLPPTTATGFNIPAGSASAVNNDGKALFFSDGSTVYSPDGHVIETGFNGDPSISQPVLLVPKPGSTVEYYLFTIKNGELSYSILNEKGTVRSNQKNILLASGVDEKLASVLKGNAKGVWITTHLQNSNIFNAFSLDEDGLKTTPVVSVAGTPTSVSKGYMKFSPNGSRLALASDFTEVFYFDNLQGKVQYPKHLFFASSYGVEFSPDGNYLYVSTSDYTKLDSASAPVPGGALLKVNISYGYGTEVLASGNASSKYGAIQMGPDGKIYVSSGNNNANCLGVIRFPNAGNSSSGYTANDFCLANATNLGLPNFPQHYFSSPGGFSAFATIPCEGDSVKVFGFSRLLPIPYAHFTIRYAFGDPASGPNDTAYTINASHLYPKNGSINYMINALSSNSCYKEPINISAFIIKQPTVNFKDTLLCPDVAIPLYQANKYSPTWTTKYYWMKGEDTLSVDTSYTPIATGTYYIKISINNQCDTAQQFTISRKAFPPLDLGADQTKCAGDTVALSADLKIPTAVYAWSPTGETSKTINVTTDGKYKVSVTDEHCTISDSSTIRFYPLPQDPRLPADTVSCFGILASFDAGNPLGFQYKWSSGETTEFMSTNIPGKYLVDVFNVGCKKTFETNLSFYPPITYGLLHEYSLCEKDKQTILLDAGEGKDWLWLPDSSLSRTKVISDSGDYLVMKANSITGCKAQPFKIKVLNICEARLFFPNAFSPNNDAQNEFFLPAASNVYSYELNIFNRWGETIFTSNEVQVGWDGTYNGEAAPPDNYVYTVYYEGQQLSGFKKFTAKGGFLLLR